jgi:hypothetical protein
MRLDIIKRATDYWSEKWDGRRMPTRPSIDPIDLVDLLPNLVVAESIDGGKDYLLRIAEAEAEKLLGTDMHGTKLSKLMSSETAQTSWGNVTAQAVGRKRSIPLRQLPGTSALTASIAV